MNKTLLFLLFLFSNLCAETSSEYTYRDHFNSQKKLALSGDVKAMESVSYLYSKGLGCPKSYVEAYAWMSAAQSRGSIYGMFGAMRQMEEEMSPQVVAEAQRRSIEIDQLIQENSTKVLPKKDKQKTPEQIKSEIREDERAKIQKEQDDKTTWQKLKDAFK